MYPTDEKKTDGHCQIKELVCSTEPLLLMSIRSKKKRKENSLAVPGGVPCLLREEKTLADEVYRRDTAEVRHSETGLETHVSCAPQ